MESRAILTYMRRKESEDSELCGFNHSDDFEDLFEQVKTEEKPREPESKRSVSQQRPSRAPSHPSSLSRTQQHFSSKQQDHILTTYRSLLRKERIPLLDDPEDSSETEREAQAVLETLHLRFSKETGKQDLRAANMSQRLKGKSDFQRQPQSLLKARLKRYTPHPTVQTFSTILSSWKAIFDKRGTAQPRSKSAQRVNKRFVCSPMKRTIDGSAFLMVSPAQPLSPRDLGRSFEASSRPASASVWPKRKFIRPACHYRPGVY